MQNKHAFQVIALAAAAAALCGCTTANVAQRNFPTRTFAEVPLEPGASIRVVARDGAGDVAAAFAQALGATLGSGEGLRLAADGEKADYWFIVDGRGTFRADTGAQIPFNDGYSTVRVANDAGGHEEIEATHGVSHSILRGMSVAIYKADGLSPVHYVELPLWSGASGPDGAAGKDEALALDAKFVSLALERVKDVFLTQTKLVPVSVPRDVDRALYDLVTALDKAAVSKDQDAIAAACEAVEKRAAEILPLSIDEFGEALKTKKWKGKEKEAEAVLAAYHLRALAREAASNDPASLEKVHAEQLRVLELSTMDSLRIACPAALARIEYKLSQVK